jgi:8-oxo-dGTP pyrophosphatase MutT (NUDIX family)
VDAQRKVTCFVTRGEGAGAELLVFWHSRSGVQVPAGTVEDGESFEEGARREVREETGLPDLELAAYLGARTYDLTGSWSVLRREVELLAGPAADAERTRWKLGRALNVGVVERRQGFARIVYAEEDLEDPGGLVYARFEGWAREADLYQAQERRFYHFRAPSGAPARWRVLENGAHDFHLYWVPLAPKPQLVKPCQEWLDEFYERLLAGVRAKP